MKYEDNEIYRKSFNFSVDVVNLYRKLCKNGHEYELYNQILKSATSIGANITEGLEGQSKKDFVSKFSIALKEAAETEYWLDLFNKTNILEENEYRNYKKEIRSIIRILSKIVRSTKNNMEGANNDKKSV
ncbi:MAG: four helix bundle protein [Candidatus Mcinerneyibacterium aminivorans]|uniref:Four helix bundle protein n=1 Tax=Candidatus Mcinerneyibacterium aminivorans TaxID=2703815 RepID=A0A5D0MBX9_9BACT|nr:MAG: four helix bundle protein [Candidatus Mcinerneyibacterium aminivorans]